MKDGRKLLAALGKLGTPQAYFRAHNLLTTGDGTPALKWGSTNAYTEDASGRPVYDWTIVDRIFDTYVQRKMKPMVEIGFMPEALSTNPQPYRHDWAPGKEYGRIYTGWTYPPKNYERWRDLIEAWARHSVDRYGAREVESWYWEVWNEPDIGYWHGTPEQYQKRYDYAADGLKRAVPRALIGGPTVTGPNGARTQEYLRAFLEHCARGTNYATGKVGSPLDYITFHAKGAPRVVEGHVRMGISNQLRAISNGFQIVASFPELKDKPIVIGESDPEGCAACSMATNPENAYRNGTMYSSYTAAQIARTYELADLHKVNLLGAVTWAFEFEDQPYFAGFRDLATNGIDKPVLNVFRMLGRMQGERLAGESSSAAPVERIRDEGVRGVPDVYALASRSGRDVGILIWNYHDDDVEGAPAELTLTIDGVENGRATLTHSRIDRDHSNAYEAWKKIGSPQTLTPEQRTALESMGKLQELKAPDKVTIEKGQLTLTFTLPRQAVSLIELKY